MTSQKDQIQALIADIDGVLQKTTPRLPWVMSGEVAQQRQVLERVRNYLVVLQRRVATEDSYGHPSARTDLLAHDIYYQAPQNPASQPSYPVDAASPQAMSAQQMLQAVMQDMGYLRNSVMQPLQADLDLLRQQREELLQELQQLEAQRQGYGVRQPQNQAVTVEVLQTLMGRLQETLSQQMAQALRGGSDNLAINPALGQIAPALGAAYQSPEQLQLAHAQSDQLLLSFDSTLRIVFESLQRDIQAYQESLSQGLDKMHSLGQQGEVMFAALVNHLAQQLGREASSYLQSPPEAITTTPSTEVLLPGSSVPTRVRLDLPTQASTGDVPSEFNAFLSSQASSQKATDASDSMVLPFPGTEMPPASADEGEVATVSSSDRAIDAWLRSAGAVETGITTEPIADLNLDDFDLGQLNTQDLDSLLEDSDRLGDSASEYAVMFPGSSLPDSSMPLGAIAESAEDDTADIDAALKLLAQLSAELPNQASSASLMDAEAHLDRLTGSSQPTQAPEAERIPDDARDELDEFYESLFGSHAIAAETDLSEASTEATSEAITTPEVPTSDVLAESFEPIALAADEPLLVEPPHPLEDLTLGWKITPGDLTVEPEAFPSFSTNLSDFDDMAVDLGDFDITSEQTAAPTANLADLFGEHPAIAPTLPPSNPPMESPSVASEALLTPDTLLASEAYPSVAPELDAVEPFILESMTLEPSEPEPIEPEPIMLEPLSLEGMAPEQEDHDQISSLTDLFGDVLPDVVASNQAAIAPPGNPPSQVKAAIDDQMPSLVYDSTVTQGGDQYTIALPGEDLLPTQEPVNETDSALWLDEATLSRLSEDLSSLESRAIAQPSESTPGFAAAELPLTQWSDSSIASESSSELGSVEDWNDFSLDDFAVALPEPEANAVLADSSSTLSTSSVDNPFANTFTLEGMNDLFADVPTPPVSPVPPPTAFTLEGIGDLFADVSAPPVSPVLPPGAPTAASTETAAASIAPAAFTLEGMDDLFADLPSTGAGVSEVVASDLTSDPSAANDSTDAATLEGIGSLFDEPPVVESPVVESPVVIPSTSADTDLPALTDGWFNEEPQAPPMLTDGWFNDMPAQVEPTPSVAIESGLDAIPDVFTLEQVGDLFMEVPAVDTPDQAPIPPIAIAPDPDIAPAAFTLEQVDDLFMEVPSGTETSVRQAPLPMTSSLEQALAEEPDFPPLDPVDDIFADFSLSGFTDSLPSFDQEPSSSAGTQAELENLTLDQAFESLMGPLDTEPSDLPASGTETLEGKKKATN